MGQDDKEEEIGIENEKLLCMI